MVFLLNIYEAKTVTIEEFSKGPPGFGKFFFDLIYGQWGEKNPTKIETECSYDCTLSVGGKKYKTEQT